MKFCFSAIRSTSHVPSLLTGLNESLSRSVEDVAVKRSRQQPSTIMFAELFSLVGRQGLEP